MNSISDNWNDNLQSLNQERNEASVPVFYADWTSVAVSQTSSLRGLDVTFIPPLPKKLPYMANNDEYNDEYLCRDFFVGFIFWPKLFQISELTRPPTTDNRPADLRIRSLRRRINQALQKVFVYKLWFRNMSIFIVPMKFRRLPNFLF